MKGRKSRINGETREDKGIGRRKGKQKEKIGRTEKRRGEGEWEGNGRSGIEGVAREWNGEGKEFAV